MVIINDFPYFIRASETSNVIFSSHQFFARVLLGCLGLVLLRFTAHSSEPVISGKPISSWLQQYDSTAISSGKPEDIERNEQAANAVRSLGTNAIPTLLKMIRTRSSSKTGLSEINNEGIDGFFILGAAASNAVPSLVEIFGENKSQSTQASAAWALAEIGPGATAAVPELLRAATNSEPGTRSRAYLVLAQIPASYEEVIPLATRALSDTNFSVKFNATRGSCKLRQHCQRSRTGIGATIN